MDTTAPLAQQANCLQLKGSLLPLTVLELSYFEPAQFSAELSEKAAQAPDFFKNLPVVIDLTKFDNTKGPTDFEKIISICRTYSIKPIAVRGGSETQQIAAKLAGLPYLPAKKERVAPPATDDALLESKPVTEVAPIEEQTKEAPKEPQKEPQKEETKVSEVNVKASRIIYQPVRSGQQIYAQDSDLIILSQVSAGAEVLADGNIHIYGPLRGRALAGVRGNTEARIFCNSLEAELVSIAGQYKISEDLQTGCWKKSAQIHLSDETLTVKSLVD
jgi:septum site-determining protein MinC